MATQQVGRKPKAPTLRKHKTGQYCCQWANKVHYLGTDRTEAETRYQAQLAEWSIWVTMQTMERQAVVERRKGPTINEGIERFLVAKSAELDRDGIAKYRSILKRLSAFAGNHQLEGLTPLLLQRLKENLRQQGYSPKTINHTLMSVRTMTRLLAGLGLMTRHDYSVVSPLALPPPEPKGMTLDEVRAFIAKATEAREQVGLAVRLQVLTACRASELPKLVNGEGVWEAEGIFRLAHHKTEKKAKRHRHLVLSKEAREILAKLKPHQWADGHYYSIAVIRIMGEGPGRLRHTAAGLLVRNGISRAEAGEFLGHAIGRVSLTYIPPVETFGRLMEIAERLSEVLAGRVKGRRKAA